MFVIVGTRTQDNIIRTQNTRCVCQRCNNEVNHKIVCKADIFTIFFIPTVPYTKEYYAVCPICGNQIGLSKEAAYNCND